VLNLASASDPAWVERALREIDEVLLDHAHCEKKAASTAVSLLFRYPERSRLLAPLAALAREELEHFERVLEMLTRRGVPFRRQVPSPYAGQLLAAARREEPGKGVDTLLCLALIEARSCERMKLLAEALPEGELRDLYASLLASEARHHRTYVDLARELASDGEVRERLAALAAHEARVLAQQPRVARMHA
jgi:tRNA 2-(methylsulfanyl)-N6-isopentenyladenosine37 hydroxylase